MAREYILTGIGKMREQLRKLEDIAKRMPARRLKKEAEEILKEAQDLVPVDTGALRASGKIIKEDSQGGVTFTVTFGNEDVDYAEIVHEDMLVYHSNGVAKYLAIPFDRRREALKKDVRQRLMRAFT